jgi:hypothetical protein
MRHDAGMTERRRRRIVRSAVIATVVVVMLPAWYVGSYGLVNWNAGSGRVVLPYAIDLDGPLFAPVSWYIKSELPGSGTVDDFATWCLLNGAGHPTSWSEAQSAGQTAELWQQKREANLR